MNSKDLNMDNMTGKNNSGASSNKPLRRLAASSMIGDHVINREGESLGKIHDMMIDLKQGNIEYVVIEFGGFLGMNQKFFAVPFNALSIAKEHRHSFILDESRESLKRYPGFDKDHWPETNLHKVSSGNSDYGGFMGANTGTEY